MKTRYIGRTRCSPGIRRLHFDDLQSARPNRLQQNHGVSRVEEISVSLRTAQQLTTSDTRGSNEWPSRPWRRSSSNRGYTRLAEGSPDFRVSFDLIFRGGKKSQAAPEDKSAEPKATAYGGSSQRGTLIVKMHDPVTAEILWTGQISEIKMNVIEPQKELNKAVRRLLMEFPPLTR